MWIKICGNTNLEDALFAAEAGADALGFVFAEGPRRVTIEQVREIIPHLPGGLETYGVFTDADFETVVGSVLECGLTGVQLHTLPDPSLPRRLRSHFAGQIAGRRLKILRVFHYSPELDSELHSSATEAGGGVADAVLIDSRTAKASGGTGIAFDWQTARPSFLRGAAQLNLIVAGGLTPENVAEAIQTLEPWGVDVVTGVEASPGRKDPARVRAFIGRARAAAGRIGQLAGL